jgi:Uncharacterized membrane protein (homolog of Drosophila rhomboid)
MLIPIKDDNPTHRVRYPYVTVGLIATCIAAYLWQLTLGEIDEARIVHALGAIPAMVIGERQLPAALALVPPLATLVTSMFLHGSVMHLAGNMLFLWVFGDNIEDACGHLRFLAFYLVSGIAATLIYVASEPASMIPVIGASGAISGVLGAYLVLHPRAKVVLMIFFGVFVHVPAVAVLSLWIALQVFSALRSPTGEGGVAWWAHIGGFFVGALLIVWFRRPGVRLFSASTAPLPRHTLMPNRSIFPNTRRRR